MITTDGKVYIKRYLAGWVPSIAQSIAFGIGDKAEAVGDRALQFEVDRSEIMLTSYDFLADRLIFKAEVPDTFEGTVYEVALYSTPESNVSGNFGSRLVSTFDSESEEWLNPDGTPAAFIASARVGADSLRLSPAVSTTSTAVLSEVALDLSEDSNADVFSLAVTLGANVANIKVAFKTDASNHYVVTYDNPGTGFKVLTTTKGSAVVTGAPDWGSINSIEVSATASSAGAGAVNVDALRVEDTDTPDPEYVMISREKLTTPFVKEAGRVQEIEFAVAVSV